MYAYIYVTAHVYIYICNYSLNSSFISPLMTPNVVGEPAAFPSPGTC